MTPAPLRVLIADDDALVRLIARAVVQKAGMVAIEAANGAEAIEVAEASTERIDLVLLDLDMPAVGGMDVLRRLRANAQTSRIPVLILTGAGDEDIQAAMAHGAAGIFPKPIVADTLLARIRELAG